MDERSLKYCTRALEHTYDIKSQPLNIKQAAVKTNKLPFPDEKCSYTQGIVQF